MWCGKDGRSEGGKFIESGAFRPGGDEGADRRAENQKTFHRYDGKVKDRSHNGKKCKTVSAG